VKRLALIATPFLLLAVGAWALYCSSLPAILRLMLRGQRMGPVAMTWTTAGLPLVTVATWGAAIWISLLIKPRER
jgi:hypothetical protein